MIKLIILDIDGCLSDGNLIYSQEGIESKAFNVKDGLGIVTWIKLGHQVAIITGRESKIVQARAKELGIQHLYQGIKNKKEILENLVKSLNLQYEEVAAIGDDLNDYHMLSVVGESFTPNNGVLEIKKLVNTVLSCNGGQGAVREMIDILVEKNKQKDDFLAVWL
ncbi:3-deoxy-D-manno-octulosonate 8-phosphate phosphatase [hydrothermal vent metagenome]|uniref:3-deoxy-D-manno-octulosonate 8-phosphate phosphatase n=1 Tax=hydrothermal vent metagenome TaxID=652676 RepID=A0A1W1D495_9ZZZZ